MSIHRHFFCEPLDPGKLYSTGDSWALITGASDSFGAAYAKRLASAGFNICLVSRTQTKLDHIAKEINEINPKAKTKIVVADFFANTAMAYFHDI